MSDSSPAELLAPEAVLLAETAADRTEAITRCGELLVEIGAVRPEYVPAMLEREALISTYVGEGFAIPHATLAGKDAVLRDALCFVRFPDGVEWSGGTATVCIGIAAAGDGHIRLLSRLAEILLDPERAAALRSAESVETVLRTLAPADDGPQSPDATGTVPGTEPSDASTGVPTGVPATTRGEP